MEGRLHWKTAEKATRVEWLAFLKKLDRESEMGIALYGQVRDIALSGGMRKLFFTLLTAGLLTSCADRRHRMIVSVSEQRMMVLDQGKPMAQFPVSTSKFGIGSSGKSNFTPLGHHEIAKKIGGGQPLGMKFKSRVPTGEIVPVDAPGRDPIVTRILWLKGLEPGNRNTYSRYIYIHGTPEEAKLGTPASYGCVRMRSVDVAWLYETVGKGARVDIVRGPAADAMIR